MNYKDFKEAFWDWFDNLPDTQKRKFWYFKEDAAEIYFYNKVWSYR